MGCHLQPSPYITAGFTVYISKSMVCDIAYVQVDYDSKVACLSFLEIYHRVLRGL